MRPDPNRAKPLPEQHRLINHAADRPVYLQVADRLRLHIESGQLRLGQKLPSETDLIDMFRVSRVSVRRAIDTLRAEGLVTTRQGVGSSVCRTGPVQRITLTYQVLRTPFGVPAVWLNDVVHARMPTPDEMTELGLATETPVLVITRRTPPGPNGARPTQVGEPVLIPVDRVAFEYVANPPLGQKPTPARTRLRATKRRGTPQ